MRPLFQNEVSIQPAWFENPTQQRMYLNFAALLPLVARELDHLKLAHLNGIFNLSHRSALPIYRSTTTKQKQEDMTS